LHKVSGWVPGRYGRRLIAGLALLKNDSQYKDAHYEGRRRNELALLLLCNLLGTCQIAEMA
jgi:hypothetical protein